MVNLTLIMILAVEARERHRETRTTSNALPPGHRISLCETKPILLGSFVTRVLHTARISNIEGIMCVSRLRKMAEF